MAQAPPFDLKLPEDKLVHFDQDATFENFVGQFQQSCAKLLCVVDGTILRYYDKHGSIPKNIRFDYKQVRNGVTEYYFRDISADSLYCVFGRDAARIFYPRIDEVDPEVTPVKVHDRSQNLPVTSIKKSTVKSSPLRITITDNGTTLTFPNPDYPIEIRSHSIF